MSRKEKKHFQDSIVARQCYSHILIRRSLLFGFVYNLIRSIKIKNTKVQLLINSTHPL